MGSKAPLKGTGTIPPATLSTPRPQTLQAKGSVDECRIHVWVEILCGPFALFSMTPHLPIPGRCFVNSWPWSWGWAGERVEMMILFTMVQNQVKLLRSIKEVYLGGQRIKQVSVIPRNAMEGERELGMGTGRQVLHDHTWE